jgi:hypothetical protein
MHMATRPEKQTPAEIVKQNKAMQQQTKEMDNQKLPSNEVPAGNPREHPSRRRS